MLPTRLKKAPRPVALTVRLPKESIRQLNVLKDRHGLSQSEVIEHLLAAAFAEMEGKSKGKSRG